MRLRSRLAGCSASFKRWMEAEKDKLDNTSSSLMEARRLSSKLDLATKHFRKVLKIDSDCVADILGRFEGKSLLALHDLFKRRWFSATRRRPARPTR